MSEKQIELLPNIRFVDAKYLKDVPGVDQGSKDDERQM